MQIPNHWIADALFVLGGGIVVGALFALAWQAGIVGLGLAAMIAAIVFRVRTDRRHRK